MLKRASCLVNPRAGYETELNYEPAKSPLRCHGSLLAPPHPTQPHPDQRTQSHPSHASTAYPALQCPTPLDLSPLDPTPDPARPTSPQNAFYPSHPHPIPPNRIAVVGAGPAGLAFSTVAARRGHTVTLYDSSHAIGGQFNLAKQIPGKEEFYGGVGVVGVGWGGVGWGRVGWIWVGWSGVE